MYKYFFKIFLFFSITIFLISSFNPESKENLEVSSQDFILPTSYIKITSPFGYRHFTGYKSHFHNGIDFANKQNTKVYATADGIVTFTKFNGAYGYTILISHNNNIKSMYCHLSKNFNVNPGDIVKQGQLIGTIGPKNLPNDSNYYIFQGEKRNGMTTGPHLHFSMIENGKYINPFNYIKKDST